MIKLKTLLKKGMNIKEAAGSSFASNSRLQAMVQTLIMLLMILKKIIMKLLKEMIILNLIRKFFNFYKK